MLIKNFEKIYQSSAFKYPENDLGDEHEPDLPFINEYLEIYDSCAICLGVHFYKLDLIRNVESFSEMFEIITSEEFRVLTGYRERCNSINLKKGNEIFDIKLELSMLFENKFIYKHTKEFYEESINSFIEKYDICGSVIFKCNYGYSNWFANDGIDFFYLISKGSQMFVLGFYESD